MTFGFAASRLLKTKKLNTKTKILKMTTKEIDHASRAHARFGPSSMSRIVNCPMSVVLGNDLPELPSSKNADEGTLAHELSELFLEAKLNGESYPKNIEDKYDGEMKRCAKRYAEFVYNIVEPYLEGSHYWSIEQKLVVSEEDDVWGTTDFMMVYKEDDGEKHAILVDYKYGVWPVDVKKNWQVATYLYGMQEEYGGATGIEDAEAYIYQPRTFEGSNLADYQPKPWKVTYKELQSNYFELIDSAVTLITQWLDSESWTKDDEVTYTRTGSHCHFCKAKGVCQAFKDKHVGNTIKLFKDALISRDKKELGNIDKLRQAGALSLDEIGFIALHAGDIEKFAKACKSAASGLMIGGTEVPGCKLITQNARRQLISNRAVLIAGLKDLGIKNPTEKVPDKILTITALDKLVGKDKITHLLVPQDPEVKSYKLVAEEHKSKGEEFENKTSMLFKKALKKSNK